MKSALKIVLCAMSLFGCSTEEEKQSSTSPCDDTLNLFRVDTQNPNVVRIYFEAKDCNGDGIVDKTVDDFTVYEGKDDITIQESSREQLDNFVAFDMQTLILIDMSGSLQDSGNLPAVQAALRTFTNTLVASQPVGLYAFDGRVQIQQIADFTTDALALHDAISGLTDFVVVDPSTNLNGAINQTLNLFNQRQQQSGEGIFHGSVMVFTDGKDQAARITDEELETRLAEVKHSVYTIGLGEDIDSEQLADLGPQGTYVSPDSMGLQDIFLSLASLLENQANSKYALAYCSPKRNGVHTLQVLANYGKGTITNEFDANGFSGGCSPEDLTP